MASYPTVTDQFCGAGGSSQGARRAGAEIRLALNHWKLAVDSHNSNFPNTDHDCTDISACDPRRYPATDILITSPECTAHSLAKGKTRKWQRQLDMFGRVTIDPAEERSRATMWDVCRFAEAHRYRIVIVENVVEARQWEPFAAWLQAMHLLGYQHRIVYLNSMHVHPTPQSRDRMYVVFWQKAHRAPDLDIRPRAWCATCQQDVDAVQCWKNPLKPWGKYKQQYIYCCPTCAAAVTPYYYCAANAIDWTLPAPRIGDRTRPLKDKTRARIAVGLKKFGVQTQLVGNYSPGWTRPVTEPTGTVTSADHHALLTPPFVVDLAYTHGHDNRSVRADAAMPTQTGQQTHGMVVPPFIVNMQATNAPTGLAEPLPTQLTGEHRYLAVPPAFLGSVNHSTDRHWLPTDASPTVMPQGTPYLVDLRGTNVPKAVTDVLSTVCASGNHHGVVVPPFLTSYYGTGQNTPVDAAIPTVTSVDRHGVVVPPFLVSYYTRISGQQAAVSGMADAVPTVPGRAVHYLATPGNAVTVDDCGFRMLQPHEIGAAMAFPQDYIVLGNQRQRVKQFGNAVNPPVMELLVERCMAVLDS